MTDNIGSISYDARIDTSQLKKDGAETEKIAKDAGEGIEKGVGDGVKKAGIALAGIGAGLTLVAKKATDFTVDYVKDANKLAREIGGTAEESSRLLFVTGRLGLETESASAAFGIFSKKIVAATEATGGASGEQQKLNLAIEKTKQEIGKTNAEIAKNGDKSGELGLKVRTLTAQLQEQEGQLNATRSSFDKIGVSVVDAQGKQKGFTDILLETADKFKALPAGAEKSALAMELFGRQGKDLLPVLNLGAQGIQDLQKRADELGLTLNQKTIGAVAAYIESSKRLKESTDAMKLAIGTATAPVLTAFNEKLSQTITSLLATEGPVRAITTNVLAFGGPAAAAAGTALTLGANIATIGRESLVASAKFGIFGIAATALTGAVGYLGYQVFDTAAKTGSFTQALGTWQAKGLSSIPIIGGMISSLSALGGVVFQQQIEQNKLKAAHDATTASQEKARVATDLLKGAELSKQGADLAVEQSQRAYNQAVAQYGPNSLEARQAHHNLQVATEGAKSATDQAKKATNEKAQADKEFAKNSEAERKLRDQKAAAEDNASGFDRAASAVAGFIRNLFNIPAKVNKPQLSYTQAESVPANGPGFAYGGYTGKGRTDEIAGIVHKGEYVIPKSAVDQRMGLPKVGGVSDFNGGAFGSNPVIKIYMNGIMARSRSDLREIAKDLLEAVNEELRSKGAPEIGSGALTVGLMP